MDSQVVGIFDNQDDAQSAVAELKEIGYGTNEISLIMKDASDPDTTVAKGAATGATAGGALGGIAGLLTSVAAISIPGLGPFLIGGPIAAALGITGATASAVTGAVTGALAGGIIGTLVSMGMPKEEAKTYEDHLGRGGILLSVAAYDDDVYDVEDIFAENNASRVRIIQKESKTHTTKPHKYVEKIEEPANFYGVKGGRTRLDDEEELD